MYESLFFLLLSICYIEKPIIIIMRRVNLLKNAGFSTYLISNNLSSSLMRFKLNDAFLQQQSRNQIYRLLLLEKTSYNSISSGILMYFHYWHRAIWCSDRLSIRVCSDSSSRNLKDSYLASYLYPAELSACSLRSIFTFTWEYWPDELAWARGPLPARSISQGIILINWDYEVNVGWGSDQRFIVTTLQSLDVLPRLRVWFSLKTLRMSRSLRDFFMSLYMYNQHYMSEDWSKTDDIDESWIKIPRNLEIK